RHTSIHGYASHSPAAGTPTASSARLAVSILPWLRRQTRRIGRSSTSAMIIAVRLVLVKKYASAATTISGIDSGELSPAAPAPKPQSALPAATLSVRLPTLNSSFTGCRSRRKAQPTAEPTAAISAAHGSGNRRITATTTVQDTVKR